MRYVDDVEEKFCRLNSLLHNNLEFLNSIDSDTELYEYIKDNLEVYVIKYRSFLISNNIPIDKVPDDIKELILPNTKKLNNM